MPQPVILQAMPVGKLPVGWPTKAGKPAWATCNPDGGYTMLYDEKLAFPAQNLDNVRDEWLDEHGLKRKWKFRVLKLAQPKPARRKPARR